MKVLLECHLFLQCFHVIFQVHPSQHFIVKMLFCIFQWLLQLEEKDIGISKIKRSLLQTKMTILLQLIQLDSYSYQNMLLKWSLFDSLRSISVGSSMFTTKNPINHYTDQISKKVRSPSFHQLVFNHCFISSIENRFLINQLQHPYTFLPSALLSTPNFSLTFHITWLILHRERTPTLALLCWLTLRSCQYWSVPLYWYKVPLVFILKTLK